jgi:hypothetical protein
MRIMKVGNLHPRPRVVFDAPLRHRPVLWKASLVCTVDKKLGSNTNLWDDLRLEASECLSPGFALATDK